jgi:hypothetical protein
LECLKKDKLLIKIKPLTLFAVTLVCFLCLAPLLNASGRVIVSGYFKNYSLALHQPKIANSPEATEQLIQGLVTNRLRLNLSDSISHKIILTLAYDFSPRVQDKSLFGQQDLNLGLRTQAYRPTDLDSRLYPQAGDSVSSFAIFQNLDRAFFTINTKLVDIYVGRQAIAWGSARVINPTDVLAPFAFNQLDVEDRLGVDAVRVRMPLGLMSELDAGYVFGHDFKFENSAFFLRSKFHYLDNDVSLLTVNFQENLLLGVDLARSIGGAGFWLESAYVLVGSLNADRRNQHQDYFRSSLGLDYSLRNGTYLFIEYHFNQTGASQPEDYLINTDKTAYQEGSVYLLGKHYLAPGISYPLTPLFTLSGQALVNLTDPSVFVMPQAEYNLAEDIDLSTGAYLGLGDNPEYSNGYGYGPFLRLRSEFGSYPDFYFFSFRIYF